MEEKSKSPQIELSEHSLDIPPRKAVPSLADEKQKANEIELQEYESIDAINSNHARP